MKKLTSVSLIILICEHDMNEEKELKNLYINNTKLKIPSSLSNLPEISTCDKRAIGSLIFTGIKYCLRSGDCMFDFGISSDIDIILMTKWIGKNGLVHSFDSDERSLKNINDIAKTNNL